MLLFVFLFSVSLLMNRTMRRALLQFCIARAPAHTVCESVLIEYTIKSMINALHGHAKRPALCSTTTKCRITYSKKFTYDICLNVFAINRHIAHSPSVRSLPESHTETIGRCVSCATIATERYTLKAYWRVILVFYERTGDLHESGVSELASHHHRRRHRRFQQKHSTANSLTYSHTFSHMYVRSI